VKETSIGGNQALIPHAQSAEVAEPRERALDDPPAPIAPQLPAILMRRLRVVPSRRDDRLNAPTGQPGPQRIAIIAAVRDQTFRSLAGAAGFPWPADGDRVKGRCETGDFRRGRRVQVCSQRRTRAIDHNGTVKLTDSKAITEIPRVSRQQMFSYAAASVAVISRQMCHL
jgi:hypothetical protein